MNAFNYFLESALQVVSLLLKHDAGANKWRMEHVQRVRHISVKLLIFLCSTIPTLWMKGDK